MVITFKLRGGIDYTVDSYEIKEDVIELKRICGKSQITILPLDDVSEIPFPLLSSSNLEPSNAISNYRVCVD